MNVHKRMYFHNHYALDVRTIEFAMELEDIKKLEPIKQEDKDWLEYLIKDLERTDERL